MSDEPEVTFADLALKDYPLTIKFWRISHDPGVDEPVHVIEVPSPGAIVIPPLAAEVGEKLQVIVEFGDGSRWNDKGEMA